MGRPARSEVLNELLNQSSCDGSTDAAWQRLQEAYQAQMEGDYDRAVELYQRSLDLHPTAEAHTFLGWTFHFQGKIEEAIAECKRAIEVDPEFGNPYNDIGAYPQSGSIALTKRFPGWSKRLLQSDMTPGTFPISTWDAPISPRA